VSTTWNAPEEAFNDNQQFLEGFSTDQTLTQLHKSYQFLGMKKIPSFEIFDVFKSPESVANQVEKFKKHLEKIG
jgi:modulator of drug activity B